MNEASSNLDVQRTLARRVTEEILGVPADAMSIASGTLATNYFSFTFPVEVGKGENRLRVFVKIPKADLRNNPTTILPISGADRRMAEDEANSLRLLADQWHAEDLSVSWVRLRTVVPEYNAIVTDRVAAAEGLNVFRRLDLRRRVGFGRDARRLRSAMARFGAALGRFHRRKAHNTVFRTAEAVAKLTWYCQELSDSTRSPWPDRVGRALGSTSKVDLEAIQVPTLKGIDIRNVLIDDQDKLFLLDPGGIKLACREADLARFIMTYRILYWGNPLFALGICPDTVAEADFLDAYYERGSPRSKWLLSFFLLKEQLKHWHTAADSLHKKSWHPLVKRLVASLYINPFYVRQLTNELRQL